MVNITWKHVHFLTTPQVYCMPRRIRIEPHLSIEQLAIRYRESKDVVERSHYQIIWLLAQGQSSAEVAQVTGYSVY